MSDGRRIQKQFEDCGFRNIYDDNRLIAYVPADNSSWLPGEAETLIRRGRESERIGNTVGKAEVLTWLSENFSPPCLTNQDQEFIDFLGGYCSWAPTFIERLLNDIPKEIAEMKRRLDLPRK